MPKTDLVKALQFELPENSLTLGDLVGRAARFVRFNYRFIYQLFLIPITAYVICWEILFWIADHFWAPSGGNTNFALDFRVGVIGGCFLAIWFCVWWLRVKALTLWLLMTESETTLSGAVKRARDFRMLWIFLPTAGIELVEAIWSTVLMIIISQADTKSVSAAFQITGLYFGLLILWLLPFRMLATFNLFPAYNALVSEPSIGKGFATFWFYCRRAPITLIVATFLLIFVANCIEMPIMIPPAIGGGLRAVHAFDTEIIEWIELIPRMVLEVLIGVFTTAMCAAFATLLDNQLKIKLEGRDITATLEKFSSRI